MSGKMMNAYRIKPDSNDPVHEVVPIPELEDGEVLLKVSAAGLCHSDLTVLDHISGIESIDKGTFTFSHEICGVCVKNGPNANAKIGQLYVCLGMNPCMKCKWCDAGKQNMCKAGNAYLGLGKDGGNAEYCAVREAILIPVPEGVSAGAATSASDAILTPYHALKTIVGLQKGQTCVVIGLGGLGLNAVAIGLLLGAKVYGTDLKQESIQAAREIGAEAMTMAELQKKVAEEKIHVDCVADCVGANATFKAGQEILGVHGAFGMIRQIVAIGLHERKLAFDTIIGIHREIRALSAFWGTKTELEEVLDYIAQGKLKPIFKLEPMSKLPFYVEEMRHHRTQARMAFVPEQYEKEAVY